VNYDPAFDPGGKYLYMFTNRHFSPNYSDFDNTFIYPNATQLAVIMLQKGVDSPLKAKNDKVAIKEESSGDKDDKKEKKSKKGSPEKKGSKAVKIDFDGLEERTVIIPIQAGNYTNLNAVSGKVLYHQYANTGSADRNNPLKYYDLKDRKEKTIMKDIDSYSVSADGKKLLVAVNRKAAVIGIKENQKIKKWLNLDDMKAEIVPKEEWKQIFTEAWRLQRDYFYDKNMHGVDWNNVRKQYEVLLNDAVTRWDVNFVIGELIGELNASHSYRGGGDNERAKFESVGYLGIDWETANGFYRIKKIIKGAKWDNDVRSPLAEPGIKVKEGNYILAVNGIKLDANKEPYHAFQGLSGKTVELLVNDKPSFDNAKTVIVKTLRSESRLRHLAWIEAKRKRVDEATGGKIGYIYVRSTGIDGQNELLRQYMGQWHKDGLIIDERFNSGGQIPDRFIELLDKKPIAYWAVRDAKDWQWPYKGNFGPKIMLINGWSGSGGDAFPDYFKKANLGPLLGTRTWGGLIGISGAPELIDGGVVTVPTFRMFHPDGKWFREGHGVDPDIEVVEDHSDLAKGIDNQLEKAIEWINKELKENPYKKPEHEPYEKR
jgi:tricorn protease